MKTAGLIIIGDEVLKGQVADQNLVLLAPRLHKLGIKLRKVSIIPDSIEDIAKEVSEFSSKFDSVITTGGVGPTHDDVTYEGVAAAFGDELVLSDEIVAFWSYFTKDPTARKASTIRLATIPKSAGILFPEVSTQFISKGKFPVVTVRNVLICPGVPKFLAAIFSALEGSYFNSFGVTFYNKAIYLSVSEQVITDALNDAVKTFSESVQFGSYPKFGNHYYHVILTLESENETELEDAYQYLISRLDTNWIVPFADLLANAHEHTMELLNSDRLGNFKSILADSIQVINKCLDDYQIDQVFISFNGGKDCTALLHLVHSVLVQRFGQKHYPKLTAVYFRHSNSFKEIENFIFEAAARYNLNLIVHDGKIKEGIRLLIQGVGKNWKACLMGVRRFDPNCQNLNIFQETDPGWPPLIRVSPMLDWSYGDVWTYLRELNVPYCPLYDQGVPRPTKLELRRIASEWSSVLCKSLGPSGLGILINDSGQYHITKSGLEIISFLQADIPQAQIFLDTACSLDRLTGDGTKTLIVMISSLFKLTENLDRSYLSQFRQLYSTISRTYQQFISDIVCCDEIYHTYFSSRFPPHTAGILSSIFYDWIMRNNGVAFCTNLYDYLLKNFDSLVVIKEEGILLSDSSPVEGIYLTGKYHGPFPKFTEKYLLYCIYHSTENQDNDEEINSEVRRLTHELNELNSPNILVITNCQLPPTSLQLLFKYRVFTQVKCELVSIVLEYLRIYRRENSCFPEVQFSMPNTLKVEMLLKIPVVSLVLYAASPALTHSYATAVKGCLRLARFTVVSRSRIIECGQFEKLLAMHFSATFGDEWLLPVIPCSFLAEWSKKIYSIRNKENTNDFNELDYVFNKLMGLLKESSITFDQEVVLIVCQFLLDFHLKINCTSFKGFEPLLLKFEIILSTLNTFLSVMNVQDVYNVKNSTLYRKVTN